MRLINIGTLAAAGALIITAGGCATAEQSEQRQGVVLGDGRDRTASRTVSDWVTYGDHVLVVTVVGEIRHPASPKELERGEGMLGRTVTLRVDNVLWSAPDAPQSAPTTTLNDAAAGWVFNDNNGEGTVDFALRHFSRLEVGHTYIRAIEWADDPCSSDPRQGQWMGLGSGDTIPFDGGVLGVGEFEGQVQTLEQARARWESSEPALQGVREQLVGQPLSTLVSRLQSTAPRSELVTTPPECDPNDR